jgi:succinoglycan biosynthesis protein ExoW
MAGRARAMITARPDPRELPRIAVLIPYFQYEQGLLRRALSSIAAQQYRPVQVVVVDDGSPHPAAEEITPELRTALPQLTVVRQDNRGVARARNATLDAVADDVSAIALLDSDDHWESSHLRHAATALARGADFFFANSRNEGTTFDYFREHPRRDLLFSSPTVADAPAIRRWSAGVSALFGAGCPFATSTVVFRRAVMPELRFSTKFRRAGEDRRACLELVARSAVVMFCAEQTLISGSAGVGTWRKSTLGSVADLVRLADELRWNRQLIDSQLLSPGDRHLIKAAMAERRREALTSALHLLRRGRYAHRELLYLFRTDPLCVVSWSIHLPRLLYSKLRSRSAATH